MLEHFKYLHGVKMSTFRFILLEPTERANKMIEHLHDLLSEMLQEAIH